MADTSDGRGHSNGIGGRAEWMCGVGWYRTYLRAEVEKVQRGVCPRCGGRLQKIERAPGLRCEKGGGDDGTVV